ncbi:hypothetical protein GJ496_003930 [Pomphorhynchus laevis]|nr:hypothetical protein GJ496_003930 [Pomphorhynchus laevis]
MFANVDKMTIANLGRSGYFCLQRGINSIFLRVGTSIFRQIKDRMQIFFTVEFFTFTNKQMIALNASRKSLIYKQRRFAHMNSYCEWKNELSSDMTILNPNAHYRPFRTTFLAQDAISNQEVFGYKNDIDHIERNFRLRQKQMKQKSTANNEKYQSKLSDDEDFPLTYRQVSLTPDSSKNDIDHIERNFRLRQKQMKQKSTANNEIKKYQSKLSDDRDFPLTYRQVSLTPDSSKVIQK